MTEAFLIVDLQYDFMPGGALGVKGGDEIISTINKLVGSFDYTISLQDYHPGGHISFANTHGKQVGEPLILMEQSKNSGLFTVLSIPLEPLLLRSLKRIISTVIFIKGETLISIAIVHSSIMIKSMRQVLMIFFEKGR